MLEIATKLSDAMQTNNTLKIEQPKSLPRSIKNFQDMPPLANEDEPWMKPDNLLPSTERVQQPAADDDEFPITSPRRQIEPVVEPKKELPVIKTKIFDDGRRRKTDRTQVTDNNNNGTAERPSAVPTDDDTFF
ncbi:unnamed protein product [Didymodactylos carnosus]|uniref:Uncharacterized protein n=2 Tax=Didymodactylos carnosus TaxID=1234261 RepID=A0A8S2RU61_9BILA|nr:unnamed protein product [Didymodactylos carnosus]CAF4185456.1 unnamed protein product [Didymodactylos carnosus]